MEIEKIKIGKIVATHGIAGDVIALHSLGKKSSFKGVEHLFIELTKNNYIPYFISSTKIKKEDETIFLFDDFKTKEAAKLVVGKNIWLNKDDFDKLVDKKSPIALLEFMVYDNEVEIGKVIEVIEQPHQILLTVKYKDSEAYLPMHEDSLINIDYKKREVILDLPEGLLDIYTND